MKLWSSKKIWLNSLSDLVKIYIIRIQNLTKFCEPNFLLEYIGKFQSFQVLQTFIFEKNGQKKRNGQEKNISLLNFFIQKFELLFKSIHAQRGGEGFRVAHLSSHLKKTVFGIPNPKVYHPSLISPASNFFALFVFLL